MMVISNDISHPHAWNGPRCCSPNIYGMHIALTRLVILPNDISLQRTDLHVETELRSLPLLYPASLITLPLRCVRVLFQRDLASSSHRNNHANLAVELSNIQALGSARSPDLGLLWCGQRRERERESPLDFPQAIRLFVKHISGANGSHHHPPSSKNKAMTGSSIARKGRKNKLVGAWFTYACRTEIRTLWTFVSTKRWC